MGLSLNVLPFSWYPSTPPSLNTLTSPNLPLDSSCFYCLKVLSICRYRSGISSCNSFPKDTIPTCKKIFPSSTSYNIYKCYMHLNIFRGALFGCLNMFLSFPLYHNLGHRELCILPIAIGSFMTSSRYFRIQGLVKRFAYTIASF